MSYLHIMALHPAMVVAFVFWRMMTLLTCVVLENHCISYISFCPILDYLCNKVTVKQILLSAL